MTAQTVTIYTVRRSPYTAAAETSSGYTPRDFEYIASGPREALAKAVADCEWPDAGRHFSWWVTGSLVVILQNERETDD